MDRCLESIVPILEILEIEVSNILYNPGNVGKHLFLLSHILELFEILFFISPYLGSADGGRAAPGVRLWGPWIIFGICSWNFVICPISGNNTFPWFWNNLGGIFYYFGKINCGRAGGGGRGGRS